MKYLVPINLALSVIILTSCQIKKTNPEPTPLPIVDKWTQKANFGGLARAYAISFVIDNKLYMGTGLLNSSTKEISKDFWEYNPETDKWTKKADFEGGARFGAVGFAIGNKGYLATGGSKIETGGSITLEKDFWEYNPQTDKWTKKADFAGVGRYNAVGFSIKGKGYIGTGNVENNVGSNYTKDFWEYDPETDKWTRKADFEGGARYGISEFVIEDKGYFIGGFGISGTEGDLWEYTPSKNQWEKKTNFIFGLHASSGFSIGNKGYVLEGSNTSFLEYDPATNQWAKKGYFPGPPRAYAIECVIGNKAYISTGIIHVPVEYSNDLWEYTP